MAQSLIQSAKSLYQNLVASLDGRQDYVAIGYRHVILRVYHRDCRQSITKEGIMESVNESRKDEIGDGVRKIIHSYPLIRYTDMNDEVKHDTLEICVAACEKHPHNNESAAKQIKETLDKKYGPAWHVVVGEGYGFDVSHEAKNLLYLFFSGTVAICVWKCS